MYYNFYLDNKNDNDIIKPFSKSKENSEQPAKNSTFSQSDNSGEIKADSENETTFLENNLESKENTENYNPNPQFQNQKSMNQTNGTQNGEFFGSQTSQGQQPNSQMNNSTGNSTQNQTQGYANPQATENGGNNPQTTMQEQNSTHGNGTENMNQDRQPENEVAENETPAVTLIDPDDLPPFKSEVWDMFQLQLKDKESFFKQKDYPRKPLMVDADLYSTLREIDIDNIAPTNLLNAILRTFIESFKEELRQYRKIQAPSVF